MKTRWASIAKIEAGGAHSGTGFLVSKKHVLTALHVVADKTTGRPFPGILLRFDTNAEYNDGSIAFVTAAHIVKGLWSSEHDFALLECDLEPPSKPLRLSDQCRPRDVCLSSGFAVQDPSGFTVIGDISSLNDPIAGGGTAIGIQFRFGSGVLMKGHSGAPVLVNDRVIGLLRTAFLDESERTMGGIVHATPVQQVVEFCDRLSPGSLVLHFPIQWPNPLPTHRPVLADRREEFEIFERMVTGQSQPRILLLEGQSGSGKTDLMTELRDYARGLGISVAEADCKGCPSMDDIFSTLLVGLPSGLLPNAETATGISKFHSLIEDLAVLEQPILLVVDSWQDSSDDVRKWIEQKFLPELRSMPGVVAVIGGQKDLPDPTSPTWGRFAVIQQLKAITSTRDWFEYSRRKWPDAQIVEQHVEAVVVVAGGWPKIVSENLGVLQSGLRARATPGGDQ